MSDQLSSNWAGIYKKEDLYYPAEGVIRILKGRFPDLDMRFLEKGTKILDLGAGDGRHFPLFNQLGFDIYGLEITKEIVDEINNKISGLGIDCLVKVGVASNIPFDDGFFDVLLTWNSCYYMEHRNTNFDLHVSEMARTIKKDGYIICSVPKFNSFIFDNSEEYSTPGYKIIHDDFFGLREGQLMRCFSSRSELEDSFSEYFSDFRHADLDMDWFGLSYKWHVFVAKRK